MQLLRWIVCALAILMLASCKIRIIVPEGGSVATQSGAYSCAAGKTCNIDVVDFYFDQVFIAKPANGYSFSSWKRGSRRFCGGNAGSCRLYTTGLDINADFAEVMTQFLESGEVFYLEPVFTRGIPVVSSLESLQGKWVGTSEFSSPAFPGQSCRWRLQGTVSGNIFNVTSTLTSDTVASLQCVSARTEARLSIFSPGNVAVDIYYHSAVLLIPPSFTLAQNSNGELASELKYSYAGYPVKYEQVVRRP